MPSEPYRFENYEFYFTDFTDFTGFNTIPVEKNDKDVYSDGSKQLKLNL